MREPRHHRISLPALSVSVGRPRRAVVFRSGCYFDQEPAAARIRHVLLLSVLPDDDTACFSHILLCLGTLGVRKAQRLSNLSTCVSPCPGVETPLCLLHLLKREVAFCDAPNPGTEYTKPSDFQMPLHRFLSSPRILVAFPLVSPKTKMNGGGGGWGLRHNPHPPPPQQQKTRPSKPRSKKKDTPSPKKTHTFPSKPR